MNKVFTQQEIMDFLVEKIAEETKLDKNEINPTDEFVSFNLDSISSIYIMGQLENYIETDLNPLYFWDYPTIVKFSKFISMKYFKS